MQIGSVQTVVRRLGELPPPDYIITDECHHAVAATYRKITGSYPNAYLLGRKYQVFAELGFKESLRPLKKLALRAAMATYTQADFYLSLPVREFAEYLDIIAEIMKERKR